MRDKASVAGASGWVLTDAGVEALRAAAECKCVPVRIGRMVECQACGTVFAAIPFDDHRYAYFDRKRD